MSQQLELQLFEADDKTHRLNFVTPAEGYTFEADDISRLIATLAQSRAQMLPPVQVEDVVVTGMQNVADDPRVLWAYDEMSDKAALVLRHPGYGWIGYALSFETVEALQAGLQTIVEHRNAQRRAMS
ncbi:hypothetical protein [Paraburkholderia caribensis]|uniref:hypothetical protein n=1 Tax=Paraburkholderia caribensis TaxID=75105 RepID=UPI0031D69F01